MADRARFWDRIAEKYAEQAIADPKAYEIKLDLTREYLTPESKVLEFGCGTGSTALLHAPYAAEIDALDISPEMIRIANEKRDAAKVANVQFKVADMDSFQAQPASYDAALGLNILHLLDDRMAVMGRVYEALKPGGHFISSTMCLREKLTLRLIEPLFPVMHAFGRWPRVRRFTSARLQTDMHAIGFKAVHLWQPGNGPVLFMVGQKPNID